MIVSKKSSRDFSFKVISAISQIKLNHSTKVANNTKIKASYLPFLLIFDSLYPPPKKKPPQPFIVYNNCAKIENISENAYLYTAILPQ